MSGKMSVQEKLSRIAQDRSIKVEEVLERVDYSKLFLLEEDLLEIGQSQEWIEFFQKDSDSFHRLLDDLFSMGLVDSNFPQISHTDAVCVAKNLIQNHQNFGESLSILTKISHGIESEDDLIWEAVKSLNLDYEMRKKFGLNGRPLKEELLLHPEVRLVKMVGRLITPEDHPHDVKLALHKVLDRTLKDQEIEHFKSFVQEVPREWDQERLEITLKVLSLRVDGVRIKGLNDENLREVFRFDANGFMDLLLGPEDEKIARSSLFYQKKLLTSMSKKAALNLSIADVFHFRQSFSLFEEDVGQQKLPSYLRGWLNLIAVMSEVRRVFDAPKIELQTKLIQQDKIELWQSLFNGELDEFSAWVEGKQLRLGMEEKPVAMRPQLKI